MDEQDIHFWGNLLINWEAKIQPLLHLIMTKFQWLHEDHEELVVGEHGVYIIKGDGYGLSEIK